MAQQKLMNDGSHGRNRLVANALQSFAQEVGVVLEDPIKDPDREAMQACISDLLTGLMHVCKDRGLAFSDVLASARTFFAEDVAEEIASQKPTYRYANARTNGSITAKMLGTSTEHVVLSVGREALIVNSTHLNRIPSEAEVTHIAFKDGMGIVDAPKALQGLTIPLKPKDSNPETQRDAKSGSASQALCLEDLRGWPSKARVSDLYDSDQAFASTLIGIFGDKFEYPDFSYKTVAQVIRSAESHLRFSDSLTTAEQIAQSKGAFRHLDPHTDERLEGKVLSLTDDHAVLSLGRSSAIVPLRALNRVPEIGENVSLKWQVGHGILTPSPKAIDPHNVGR